MKKKKTILQVQPFYILKKVLDNEYGTIKIG